MHIICRGDNKQNIFIENQDKQRYRCLLEELKEENKITLFHYCMMDNHVHLVTWLNEESRISRFMKQVNLSYFNFYRKKYGYTGHFWQDRFKSNIIENDTYLLQCGKYIELNPVRAKITNLPQEYHFSSYNYYAKGNYDKLVTASPAYTGLANSDEIRRKLYTEFVVDSSIMNKEIFLRQSFIGSEGFINKLQEYYNIRNMNKLRGRPRDQGK